MTVQELPVLLFMKRYRIRKESQMEKGRDTPARKQR